jgi:hypothetical protein
MDMERLLFCVACGAHLAPEWDNQRLVLCSHDEDRLALLNEQIRILD